MDCPDKPGNDGGDWYGVSTIVITGLVPVIHLSACWEHEGLRIDAR